jgi:SAM-dependent methyltransferase
MCYPTDYYTHQRPAVSRYNTAPAARSLRDGLRSAIRHYADGAGAEILPIPLKLAGRLLARVPTFRVRARYGLIDVLSPGGSGGAACLEVGPGQGQTLGNLRKIGWSAMGLDIDSLAAETAAGVSGCEVRVGTLLTADLARSSFQLIYMSHVVEHLSGLKASLHQAFTLLAPGGRLVLLYPNPEALSAMVDPYFSCNWDAPRHLALPPISAMKPLLAEIGFAVVKSSTPAMRAACHRNRARQYRRRKAGLPVRQLSTAGDHLFSAIEAVGVFFGASIGEEILLTAYKSDRERAQ